MEITILPTVSNDNYDLYSRFVAHTTFCHRGVPTDKVKKLQLTICLRQRTFL